MSPADARSFRPLLDVWKPSDQKPAIVVRWFITEWCNYSCAYCPQTHGRWEPKGENFTAHAFDNFTVEEWTGTFSRHFRNCRLSLVITGGEPLLDCKSMVPLLQSLTSMDTMECIRIDTNAFWKPSSYSEIDKSKIILMCTFHPTQISEQRFFARIDEILASDFKIGIINYVMSADNKGRYYDYRDKLNSRGVPLHPNPLWNSIGKLSQQDQDLFRNELPEVDYRFRTGIDSPRGKKCLFPSISYELNYKGEIHIGCHKLVSGNFFSDELPELFAGPVPCPHNTCVCLDKYSFLEGVNRNVSVNPLKTYSELLMRMREQMSHT